MEEAKYHLKGKGPDAGDANDKVRLIELAKECERLSEAVEELELIIYNTIVDMDKRQEKEFKKFFKKYKNKRFVDDGK